MGPSGTAGELVAGILGKQFPFGPFSGRIPKETETKSRLSPGQSELDAAPRFLNPSPLRQECEGAGLRAKFRRFGGKGRFFIPQYHAY